MGETMRCLQSGFDPGSAGLAGVRRFVYFGRTAIGSMVRSPFVHVIAVAALGLSLLGFGLARIAASQLDALLASLGG